jgi:serine/threonine protein kinase
VRNRGALDRPSAKLLDFGLAKSSGPAIANTTLSMLPTTPPNLTAEGAILGTFRYMSPEQLEGHEPARYGFQFRTSVIGAVVACSGVWLLIRNRPSRAIAY